MRRVLSVLAAGTALAGAALATGAGDGDGRYRVDAIFDNVAFLTPGQDVRVAGATVGEIVGLRVTADHRARVEMAVDPAFAPFRADADCVIQPQSLIGEKYVQCTPGTSAARELVARGEDPPTVPVQNTHAPIDTDLVLGTFDRPARERLGILLGSLGAGLAGRGDDVRAAILRANPALAETRRVLETLEADRADLRRLLRDGDTVLTALAGRRDRVRAFLRSAADVADTTAARRARLRGLVRDLPGFLDEARPALAQLTELGREGAPLARDLRAAAPAATELVRRTGDFSGRLAPTLTALRPTLRATTAAVPDVAPQLRRLQRFATAAQPTGGLLRDLGVSFRDNGGLGGVGSFLYHVSSAVARFDRFSHILPAYVIGTTCALHSTTPVPGCDAHYAASADRVRAEQRAAARGARPAPRRTTPARPRRPAAAVPEAAPRRPGERPAGARPVAPLPAQVDDVVRDALDAIGGLGGGLLGGRDGRREDDRDGARDLLEYLLG